MLRAWPSPMALFSHTLEYVREASGGFRIGGGTTISAARAEMCSRQPSTSMRT